ncbi:MAG: DUF3285 domain-containing protein [Cyanobacteria bacterium]|nr:DUF3285 domain-containing protein [Cyanobacteriota bacterium]MDW8199760.1 DUF3285 domain-containing protein [Cyanobacteriota bacterium SKYGB_h_bin112]
MPNLDPVSSPSSPETDLQDTISSASRADNSGVEKSPPPSYVKLAMRNMVRKRGKSLYHFALTTLGLLAVLIGLSYLTR